MTETVVVVVINFVLVVASGIFFKTTEKRAAAKSSIIRAFRKIYIEFGNITAAGVPADIELRLEEGVSNELRFEEGVSNFNALGVEKAAKEIQELHWQSILDITKLVRIEWILSRAMWIILLMAIVAIASNIIGNFLLTDEGNLRTVLRFCVPGILAFCEFIFVIWMANTGSYLTSVINKYNYFEF